MMKKKKALYALPLAAMMMKPADAFSNPFTMENLESVKESAVNTLSNLDPIGWGKGVAKGVSEGFEYMQTDPDFNVLGGVKNFLTGRMFTLMDNYLLSPVLAYPLGVVGLAGAAPYILPGLVVANLADKIIRDPEKNIKDKMAGAVLALPALMLNQFMPWAGSAWKDYLFLAAGSSTQYNIEYEGKTLAQQLGAAVEKQKILFKNWGAS
jgi:hypothetical protein